MKRLIFLCCLVLLATSVSGVSVSLWKNINTALTNVNGASDTLRFSNTAGDTLMVYFSAGRWVMSGKNATVLADSAIYVRGGVGEVNTLADTGTFNGTSGFGLAGGKTALALKIKGLIEGSNITIAASGDSAYTITAAAAGGTVDTFYVKDTSIAGLTPESWLVSGDTIFVDTSTYLRAVGDTANGTTGIHWLNRVDADTLSSAFILVISSVFRIGGDDLTELVGYALQNDGGTLKLDSADAVANGEILPVTGNAVYDYIIAQGFLTGNETITLSGDVTGSGATAITATVVDDSHNHVITNIDAFTESELETQLSDVTALFTNNVTGDVVVFGGTSSISAGVIVEADLDVTNSPTDNYLLSFNSGGSNFTWVAAGGGASDTALVLSEAAGGDDKVWWSGDTLHVLQSEDDDTLHVFYDGSNWVIGSDGKTIMDSALVNFYIDFANIAAPAHAEGRLYYERPALTYYNAEADIAQCLGFELWMEVKNVSGATILDGKAVYVSGGSGQRPSIELAKADATATSRCIGLATHDIEDNGTGYITTFGDVKDINTATFTDSDTLYLSADTAGAWSTTKPAIVIPIGYITNAHGSSGAIVVDRHHTIIDTNTVFGLDTYVNLRTTDSLDSYFDTANVVDTMQGLLAAYFDTSEVVDTVQAMMQRLFDTTATDAQILVANGTKFNSVAVSGDISIDNAGVTAVVDVPADIVLLNEIGDPDGNTSIGVGSNNIVFNFANPASNGFELNATGAFSGDLLHVHQHTGNPGAVQLGHFEAVDVDVLPLFVTHAGRDTTAAFEGGAVYMDSLDVDGAVRIAGSITEVDSLDMDSGLYVSDDITATGTVSGDTVNANLVNADTVVTSNDTIGDFAGDNLSVTSNVLNVTIPADLLTESEGTNPIVDADVPDDITIDQSDDVDTTGTDIAAALAAAAASSLNINPFVFGDLYTTGVNIQTNWKFELDTVTHFPYAINADTFIHTLTVYDACDTTGDWDSTALGHGRVLYVGGGWPDSAGPTHFMVATPLAGGQYCAENVVFRVSYDGINWQKFYNSDSTDSAPDPILVGTDFGASYLSDPDIGITDDFKIAVTGRAHFVTDSNNVIVVVTADGLVWTDTTTILTAEALSMDTADFLSPCWTLERKGSYSMWAVEDNGAGTENTVLLYHAPKIDSGWAFVDTCTWAPTVAGDIWHLEIVPYGPSQRMGLVQMTGNDGAGANSILYASWSYDSEGLIWTDVDTILLGPSASGWDEGLIYGAGGFWVNMGERIALELYYTGNSNGPSPSDGDYHIGKTYVFFKDSAAMADKQWVEDSAWGWDNVSDTTLDYIWATDIYGKRDGPDDSCELSFGVFTDEGSGTFEIAMARDSNISSQDDQRDDFIIVWQGLPNYTNLVQAVRLYYRTSDATETVSSIDSLIWLGPSDSTLGSSFDAGATYDSVNVNLADVDGTVENWAVSGLIAIDNWEWQPALRVVIEVDAGEYVDILRAALLCRRITSR